MFSEKPEPKRVTGPLESPLLADAILDHAGMLILVLDLFGRIVRFNRACELLTGYSEAEAQGQPFLDLFIPPDELEEITDLFKQWSEGQNLPNRRTNFVITRAGQRRLISWINTAIPASENEPGYILSLGEDVTESHLLKQRVSETLTLNEKILATVPVGITVYRADGQCILATENTEHILHASRDQIVQQNFRRLESWHRTGLLQAAEKTLTTGEMQTVSVHTTSSFGHEVWLECRTAAFQLDGQPHLLMTTDDVSQQHKVEAELRRAENRYRTLVEQIPAVTYIAALDEHSSTLYYSPQVEKLLGFTPAEMQRDPDLWRKLVHPDDRQPVMDVVNHNSISGKPVHNEYRIRRKDGREIWVSDDGDFVRDEQGKPQYLQGVMADITGERQATQELERRIAERTRDLARSNADLEQFAYIVSHDLQEPLRMVSSFAQLLARRYEDQLDEHADDYIHYVTEGVQRMQHLIDDLLAYSRVGTRGKAFSAVDTEKALAQALANLQMAIAEQDARITYDPLPTVQGDEIQLIQLFQNLIANAIKFHSAEPPGIHISATRKDQDWIFAVRDNGIGIDPEYFERIFIIFQRLHLRSEYPGTGIGLAICKKIVERHNGRIWVKSAPGQGSTFSFTLPWTSSASS